MQFSFLKRSMIILLVIISITYGAVVNVLFLSSLVNSTLKEISGKFEVRMWILVYYNAPSLSTEICL